jgi:beta-N-acetylhexosaminidase
VREIIRGAVGFDGLLMSDDLSMRALSGTMAARARAVIAAGSDVALHCSGAFDEMEAAAAAVPDLTGRALQRWRDSLAVTRRDEPYDRGEAQAALARVLATGAAASESV